MARRCYLLIGLLVCGLLAGIARGETFKLADGKTVTGEMLAPSATDAGVKIKVGDGEYETVTWGNFSQEDLKRFSANKKLDSFVEPFIEITQEEKVKKTEVPSIKQPPRLAQPEGRSFFGALFSSGLGLFVVLVLYAANMYAGYEVAIFRAQPPALVCGVSAVAPLIGPIVFLSMPTKIQPTAPTWETEPEPSPEAVATETVNPMQGEGVAHPGALKLHSETPAPAAAAAQGAAPPAAAAPKLPPTVTFQRGQFTFNRRFFETKFAAFFGVVRRDANPDMVLMVKAVRGTYIGQRISRISSNDLHLQVQKGAASEEVMIPFAEIQEIQLKHKDA